MYARLAVGLLAATVLSTTSFAADETTTSWRLFVADKHQPTVIALDAATGDTIDTFTLTSPAQLYAFSDGEGIAAVQGDADQVTAILSGLDFDDHGDHGDLSVTAPRLGTALINGERPVHFVEHDGDIAIFFDGSGKAALFDGEDWLGGAAASTALDSGAPHHGVAVPWDDGALVSKPVAEDGKLPTGLNLFDEKGNILATTDLCAEMHGEASSGDTVAFGCSDGVLLVQGDDVPSFTLLPYDGLPEERVGTLLGGTGMQFFLGNFGKDHLVVIEAAAKHPYRLVDLPFARIHFALHPTAPRTAFVLLANGSVHELDIVSGKLGRSVAVTAAYATDGGHGVAMPRLAVAGDRLAVSDPATGKVHLVDIESFTLSGEIDVGGTPSSIVAVGGSGAKH